MSASAEGGAGGGHGPSLVYPIVIILGLFLLMCTGFWGCQSLGYMAPARMPVVDWAPRAQATPQIIIVRPDGTTSTVTGNGTTPTLVTAGMTATPQIVSDGKVSIGVPGFAVSSCGSPPRVYEGYTISGPPADVMEEGRLRLNLRDGLFIQQTNLVNNACCATPVVFTGCRSSCGRCRTSCNRFGCSCPGHRPGEPCHCR